jgi:tRNA pseudouridine65 synthase
MSAEIPPPFAHTSSPDSPAQRASPAAALPVLYADAALIAVHKPSGLLVHRTTLDPRAAEWALQSARRQAGGARLYPVHRLDRGTSGVLVFARSREAHRALSAEFAAHEVRKTYLALVRGWPASEGCIEEPLARIIDVPGSPRASGELQAARTSYRRLATVELAVRVDRYPTSRYALVELAPLTGRRHQLRRHMRKLDHPLIGDTTYGHGRHNRLFRSEFGVQRLLLAAVELTLTSPATGATVAIAAPLAADFWAPLVALGLAASIPPRWRPGADPL